MVAVLGYSGLADPRAGRRWVYDGRNVGRSLAAWLRAQGTVLPARRGRAPANGFALPEKDSA